MRWTLFAAFLLACVAIAHCGPENDDLAPFGRRPTGAFTNEVSYNAVTKRYSFFYKVDGQVVTEYFVQTDAPSLTTLGTWEIGVMDSTGANPMYIATGCAPNLRDTVSTSWRPFEWATKILQIGFSHSQIGNVVALNFTVKTYLMPGNYTQKYNVELAIEGKTMIFKSNDPTNNANGVWWGYHIGPTRNTPQPLIHRLPYLPDPVFSFEFNGQRHYGSTYLDRSKSGGYTFSPYFDKTDDTVNVFHAPKYAWTVGTAKSVPMTEVGYLTVSSEIRDVLPSPHITSDVPSHLPDLTDRVFLDLWNVDCSAYTDNGVDAVRQWTAPATGLVKISTDITDVSVDCGNGVIVFVKHGTSKIILSKQIENGQLGIPLATEVNMTLGESLYFHVYAGGNMNCDMTKWTINITIGADRFSSLSDFNTFQGFKRWSYLQYQHVDQSYSELTYDSTNQAWRGTISDRYPEITNVNMHPATTVSAGGVNFACYRRFIEELSEYGLKRMSIVAHFWQQFGFDVKLPSHFPADPARGGSEAMQELINATKSLGHLIALHENYVDMYPDSPLYNPLQLVLIRAGVYASGWFNPVTGVTAQLTAVDAQQSIVAGQHASIVAEYDPNAGFEDVDTCVEPYKYINLDSTATTAARSYKQAVELKKNLWNQFKTDFSGPLYGEGREISNLEGGLSRYDVYYAGYTDGHEAQVEGKMGSATLPEFAQYINKNNQFNNGMGYIGRYVKDDLPTIGRDYPIDSYVMDRYRAQQIAFGHSGWIAFSVSPVFRWGRPTLAETLAEYHLSRGVQERYFSNMTTSITYALDNSWVDLGEYVAANGDITNNVVKIELQDNTKIVVNNRQTRLWTAWPSSGAEYTRAVQFAQHFGYYFYNHTADAFQPFSWNPVGQLWTKTGFTYCKIITNILGNDNQLGRCDATLVFAPKKPYKDIQISYAIINKDGTQPDHVTLRVLKGVFSTDGSDIAAADLTEVHSFAITAAKTEYKLNVSVAALAANEALVFRMDQNADANYDTIGFRVWITADGDYQSITPYTYTVAEANNIVLPPNGFVAWNEHLDYLAYSAKLAGDAIAMDYSKSQFSTFARSRSGVQTIEGITTDGAVAVEAAEYGSDMYFGDVKTVTVGSKLVLTCDTTVNGHVHHINETSFEIKLTTSADLRTRIQVVYGGFPIEFLQGHAQLFGNGLTVETLDFALGVPAIVDTHSSGTAVSIDMTAGQTLRISYQVPETTPDGSVIPPAGSEPSAGPAGGNEPSATTPTAGETPDSVSTASSASFALAALMIGAIVSC